jgi:hypothetical protein
MLNDVINYQVLARERGRQRTIKARNFSDTTARQSCGLNDIFTYTLHDK